MSKKMNYSQFLADKETENKKPNTEVLTINGILPLGHITVTPVLDAKNDLFISKFSYVTEDKTRRVVYQIDADIVYKDNAMALLNTRFAPDEIFFSMLSQPENRVKAWDGSVEQGKKRNFVTIKY